MTTASITKNFVVQGEEQVNMFLDALEWCMAHPVPINEHGGRFLADPKEIDEFMARLKAKQDREASAAYACQQ